MAEWFGYGLSGIPTPQARGLIGRSGDDPVTIRAESREPDRPLVEKFTDHRARRHAPHCNPMVRGGARHQYELSVWAEVGVVRSRDGKVCRVDGMADHFARAAIPAGEYAP